MGREVNKWLMGFRLQASGFRLQARRLWLAACSLQLAALFALLSGCGIYTLGGASIPPEMKTISVPFFENNAAMVVPNLTQTFTERLKERIRSQSKLSIVQPGVTADGTLEGAITDYSTSPVAVEGNNRAGLLRLSITVNVKYTNRLKETDGFDQSFTRYVDFAPPLSGQEQQRIADVNKQLAEDIFNRAFANW